MRNTVLISLLVSLTSVASAYEAGTYTCPGRGNIPPNVYVLKKLSVAGETLPYLELTRNFANAKTGEIETAILKGFATAARYKGKSSLSLAAVTLEFDAEGKLGNCTFVPAQPSK